MLILQFIKTLLESLIKEVAVVSFLEIKEFSIIPWFVIIIFFEELSLDNK